ENTWAKRPVSANIDAPEENNKSHSGIIEKTGGYASRLLNQMRSFRVADQPELMEKASTPHSSKSRENAKGTRIGDCAYMHCSLGIVVEVGLMKDNIARGVASICFLAVCSSAPWASQQSPGLAQAPTIRVQSSLVLVDVISQDRKSGLPVRDFKKEDFRLFDNRQEVRIATFDAGA